MTPKIFPVWEERMLYLYHFNANSLVTDKEQYIWVYWPKLLIRRLVSLLTEPSSSDILIHGMWQITS